MTQVIIEGTITPSVELGTGERRTVQLTPAVQNRVNRGFVKIVEVLSDDTAWPADEYESIQNEAADDELEPLKEPAGNASTDEWLSFLEQVRDSGRFGAFTIPVNEDGETPGREGLKDLWQQVSGGS